MSGKQARLNTSPPLYKHRGSVPLLGMGNAHQLVQDCARLLLLLLLLCIAVMRRGRWCGLVAPVPVPVLSCRQRRALLNHQIYLGPNMTPLPSRSSRTCAQRVMTSAARTALICSFGQACVQQKAAVQPSASFKHVPAAQSCCAGLRQGDRPASKKMS